MPDCVAEFMTHASDMAEYPCDTSKTPSRLSPSNVRFCYLFCSQGGGFHTFSSMDVVAKFRRNTIPKSPTIDGRRSNAQTIRDDETRATTGEMGVFSAVSFLLNVLCPCVSRLFGFCLVLD